MSLQRLPPDRSPEKATGTQTAKAFTPKPSYSLRVIAQAWPKAKAHAGVKTFVSVAVGAFVAWLKSGISWPGVGYGLLTFILVMAALFVAYLFLAPRDLDEAKQKEIDGLNGQIALLQETIDDLTRHKLAFELDTSPLTSQVCLNDNDVNDPNARAYSLKVHLEIRYHSDNVETKTVRNILLSIVTVSGDERPLTGHIIAPTLRHPKDPMASPWTTLEVRGSETTIYYLLDFLVEVPRECAESLDDDSFLRVTMEATRQEPSFKDFEVNWAQARNENAPLILRGA